MTTHRFSSSGAAYDACQCDETVKNGDTLFIPSEKVVGLAHTWPVAISKAFGALHFATVPLADLTDYNRRPSFAAEQIKAAVRVAIENDCELASYAEPYRDERTPKPEEQDAARYVAMGARRELARFFNAEWGIGTRVYMDAHESIWSHSFGAMAHPLRYAPVQHDSISDALRRAATIAFGGL